jgi:hypothetical protein
MSDAAAREFRNLRNRRAEFIAALKPKTPLSSDPLELTLGDEGRKSVPLFGPNSPFHHRKER